MGENTSEAAGWSWNTWRIAGWCAAGLLLLIPLIAMQFTSEVNWTPSDFVFMGLLILAVGIPMDFAMRKGSSSSYKAGAAVGLLTAFFLIWANGAVGIIGSENNDVNLLYGGVLGIGIVGALLARFRSRGMVRTMLAVATAQICITIGAIVAGAGGPHSGPLEIVLVNGFFITMWLASAALFYHAAKEIR